MRKVVSFILAVVLLLPMSLTPSYAKSDKGFIPPGLAKKGGLPPGIAKKFEDVDKYEWAQKSIERMSSKGIINGINDNEFAPSKNVTKIESLAMIIRTMKWDDEADEYLDLIKSGKETDKLKNKLQDWGKGYIEVALDKGIIDEVDVLQDNFTTPATRQEVAKYIIRALGYEEDAEKYMDEKLKFKDTSAVQIGNVGYIYLINEKEIMTGYPDGTFRPNQPIKRVEMAKLIDTLDEQLNDKEDNDETDEKEVFSGKITEIDLDNEEIFVKTDNKERLFEIDNDTVIKINGEKEDFEDLYVGMEVKVKLTNDKVTEIYSESITKEYEGKIVEKSEGNVNKLTIKVDGINKTFEVDEDATIELENDEDGEFEDLKVGLEIEAKVVNNIIVEIQVED